MIGSEAPTQFDLRFRLFGFPIRVSPWFWLVMALFGSNLIQALGLPYLFLWIGCGFVSILVHELGHAFAYRLFGARAEIVLHGFGGYARGQQLRSPWQRMLVSLAGPFAQFALAAAVHLTAVYVYAWDQQSPILRVAKYFLLLMNIVWAVLNLVPVLPLDGGNVMREVFQIVGLRNPDAAAHLVSVFVAALMAARGVLAFIGRDGLRLPVIDDNPLVSLYTTPGPMFTFWLVMLAIDNYQRYQMFRAYRPDRYLAEDDDDTPPWRRR